MDLFAPYEHYTSLQILLEIIASFCGVISVVFFVKKSILGYPTGIVSTVLYTYLLYGWGLWGDMLINFYYTVMSIYGWIFWFKQKENTDNYLISKLEKKEYYLIYLVFIFSFLFTLGVYYLKNNYLHPVKTSFIGNFSWIDISDCLTTAIFLIGMYLMAKIKIEHWIYWIVGNFISIFLYFKKGYTITSILYFILLIAAYLGYLKWKESYEKY